MKKNLNELFEEFVRESRYSLGLSEVTIRGYESSFKLLSELIPNLSLDKITPEVMNIFFEHLQKRKRLVGKGGIKVGVKNSTIATYRSKLSRFFDWLRIRKYIDHNPFMYIKAPKVEYLDKKFIKKDDIDKIISAVLINIDWKNSLLRKRNYAIVATFLFCGLRLNELVSLRLDDIDFDRMEVFVRGETSKTGHDRIVNMNLKLFQILKDYLEERKKTKNTSPYFFISSTHNSRFTKDGVKHMIKRLNDESGVKFHAHMFRHTFAMNCINQGYDISELQQILGHKGIKMTSIYLRCRPTHVMKAKANKLTFENLI